MVKPDSHRRRWTDEDVRIARALRLKGRSCGLVGAALGRTAKAVSEKLRGASKPLVSTQTGEVRDYRRRDYRRHEDYSERSE